MAAADSQITPISHILSGKLDWLTVANVVECVLQQVDGAGWGLQNSKLKGGWTSLRDTAWC